MTKPIYVVQYPRSNTNPSDKYRCTEASQWERYAFGNGKVYTFTEHDSAKEAKAERDRRNGCSEE